MRQACSHHAIPEPPGLMMSTDVWYYRWGLVILLELVIDVTHTGMELAHWCWLSCFVLVILVKLTIPSTMLVTESSGDSGSLVI
jgi:hypothetical protein